MFYNLAIAILFIFIIKKSESIETPSSLSSKNLKIGELNNDKTNIRHGAINDMAIKNDPQVKLCLTAPKSFQSSNKVAGEKTKLLNTPKIGFVFLSLGLIALAIGAGSSAPMGS